VTEKDSPANDSPKPVLARAELIQLLRRTLSISGRDAGYILDSLLLATIEALERNQEVRWSKIGHFGVRRAAPREGRNPKTGQKTRVLAQKKAGFSLSETLRRRLAQTFGVSFKVKSDIPGLNQTVGALKAKNEKDDPQ
jgi:integration host factor subunit alpha